MAELIHYTGALFQLIADRLPASVYHQARGELNAGRSREALLCMISSILANQTRLSRGECTGLFRALKQTGTEAEVLTDLLCTLMKEKVT